MLLRLIFYLFVAIILRPKVDAEPSRRKGELRNDESNDLETWTGKWFPGPPTPSSLDASLATEKTTTTEKPTISMPRTAADKSLLVEKDDKTTNDTEFNNWTGPVFPFSWSTTPATTKSTASTDAEDCDDGTHGVGIDFDASDKRHSYRYLCLNSDRKQFTPNLRTMALLNEHFIPKVYEPPVKCLNESISYDTPLPVFGSFRPVLPVYGDYEYLPPQRYLRCLADGAIVMVYHPCADKRQVSTLRDTLKSCMYRHIVTPSQDLTPERPIALLTWGKSLQMSVVDDKLVVDFIRQNAKQGFHLKATLPRSENRYRVSLKTEAHLVTDIDDVEICGYKEM